MKCHSFASEHRLFSLCLCASVVCLLLLSCSQNEYTSRGAAPPAPQNPRDAHVIDRGATAGMNQVAAPEEEPSPGGQTQAPGLVVGTYTGTVILPLSLGKRFKPGETLFIILRAPDGSPTPVAAVKTIVQSFPVQFEISQKDAMMGGGLPPSADLLLRLDADGDLSTRGPDDLVGGPVRAKAGVPSTLELQEPPK